MRLLAAMMKHETNTFSPVPTDLRRFARGADRPPEGAAAHAAYAGTGTALGAFIDLATQQGASLDIAVAGNAAPSGRVPDQVFEYFCDRILEAAHGGYDAVLLDLHGAMVT
ncbi:MAG: M81 family metallopeptidase, partial [Gammaproteobacteria bacterium]|nr:M81 family metallopeptidase [Gammaproteobacteria bacterium]